MMRLRLLSLIGSLLLSGLAAGGCSGVAKSSHPSELSSLQSVANDHLSALLTVKRLFSIFYPRPSGTGPHCKERWEKLPRHPGDPGDLTRWRHTFGDCRVEVSAVHDGGRGSGVVTWPDGRKSTWTSGPYVWIGYWQSRHLRADWWDGTHLEEDVRYNATPGSYNTDWVEGRATFKDGQSVTYSCDQGDHEDTYTLGLSDRSRLKVAVPLFRWWDSDISRFEVLYAIGAHGEFVNPNGARLAFRAWGRRDKKRWEQWRFTAPGDLTGEFTLGDQFEGEGALLQGSQTVAALRWGPSVDGDLEPVGVGSVDSTPSAAARNCAFDRWLAQVAALGPKPAF